MKWLAAKTCDVMQISSVSLSTTTGQSNLCYVNLSSQKDPSVPTGWESGGFQSGPMAAVRRKISKLLVENSAVLRLVTRLCIELYIAVVLVSNSPY
jgi:hypothetical protein